MQNNEKASSPAKKTKGKKIAFLVLLSFVLLLVSIASVAIGYINSKLNLIDYATLEDDWVYVSDSDVLSDTDSFEAIEEDVEIVLPENDIFKDKNVVNILFFGTDERSDKFSNSARSDSMMLISINKNTDKIKLVSLERGMAVKMPNGKVDYLTHAFHYGGPKWVISCVQSHFNVDVEKYIRVNFNVFEKLIDSIGGVDIELTEIEAQAMNHEIPTNTFKLSRRVNPGMNHMNGFEALQYCRLRWTDNDWVRIKRQRTTIAAIQKQCRNLSITELDGAVNAVLPMVQTNLEKDEILSLIAYIPKLLNSSIEDMTIPAEGTFSNLSHIDFNKNSQILHEFFYEEG